MKFIEKYPIKDLQPADYNPRKISEESFERLKESITKFGVIIPLILNNDGTLIAGHQRTKAIKAVGIDEIPVYYSGTNIGLFDEIQFNLKHNMIETNTSEITIDQKGLKTGAFNIIEPENINVGEIKKAVYIDNLGEFLQRYGAYDGIVVDYNDNILNNGDYAYACKLTEKPLLCYKLPKGLEDEFKKYMLVDYGEYNWENLDIKSYNQTALQPPQRVNLAKASSTLYEGYVIPYIKNLGHKDFSLFDFGAGKLAYVQILRKEGYNTFGYEPFYRSRQEPGKLNIGATVKMIKVMEEKIRRTGLFDVGVSDVVINATINESVEHDVVVACNSLLKEDGKMFFSTRNIEEVEVKEKAEEVKKRAGNDLVFRDNNNFSLRHKCGSWYIMNWHTPRSFKKLLTKYFNKVSVTSKVNHIVGVCEEPKKLPLDMIEKSINNEFNFEYPGGIYHNEHKGLCEIILEMNEQKTGKYKTKKGGEK